MNFQFIAQSFLWTGITVGCYVIGLGVCRAARHNALANPVLIAMTLVAVLLYMTGTPYAHYFRATWTLTFLLAPATVALGVPLAKNLAHVRRSLRGVILGLLAGSVVSMVSGVFLVRLLGGSKGVAMAMLPKAVTTPIAISVAAQIGGQPALTASLAIAGGVIAAITLRAVLAGMKITNEHAAGLAAGTAGSGIAAAHVAKIGDGPAAFAAIGIGLNGMLTALLAPWIASFFY
jgi:putative effector of murein hydrolase